MGQLEASANLYPINAGENVTICGGHITLTAWGEGNYVSSLFAGNNVTIHGGQVSAMGSHGISTDHGTITLGLSNATDYINASSYELYFHQSSIRIADGQTLTDGTNNYSGTLTSEQRSAIAGKTLMPEIVNHFSVSGDEYTIHTAKGWDYFCDALQDNTTWNRFSGKTVKLGNSISVTRMAGSDAHDFSGTFDGNGKTLTVNLNSNDITDGSNQYVAPFRYVSNVNSVVATIKNLHVTGNITTGKQFTGGLIGGCWGAVSIENCSVSTAITSTISGAGGHGGIVGIHSNGTLTITGTVFDGSLLGTTTHSVGGFIGWRNGSARIYNSLFAPAAVSVSNTTGATFGRNDVDTYNCYYTTLLCDGENYVPSLVSSNMWRNGTAPFIYNAKPDGIGTEGTTYNVSGITAYENGIKCGTEYYTAAPTTLALAANLADGNYWTTFYCGDAGYKINDEENACAYTAEYTRDESTQPATETLTLHKLGKVIPKGTAVIIVDEDNSIGMTASTAAAEYSVENNLHGMDVRTLKSTLGSGTFYVMGMVGDNFGFFEYTADYMPARKAYLLVDGGASLARGLRMVLEEEETGISPPPGPSLNGGEWYDLSGRKLDGKPTTKGVYIVNGKKVVVK